LDKQKAAALETETRLKNEIAVLEKSRRGRVFRPVRKKAPQNAYEEKVDIKGHIGTLKKTGSVFLQSTILSSKILLTCIVAKQDHVRSQTTRGELLFGIKTKGTTSVSILRSRE